MSSSVDKQLYERAKALIQPGDVDLAGCIVHTNLDGQEDLEMQELTISINEILADHAGDEETYIYAGNDTSEFASNQFQGLTLENEEFVWECQQLLRDGSFDLVFYYMAGVDQEAIATDLGELDGVDNITIVP
ncbi:MAG: hypothetical protein A07HR60_01371 [uncultured archaeon A07HR60]|nr:MAG: hypothetical protein A07HR60_01371 [uncultured archaeon A07HR60]